MEFATKLVSFVESEYKLSLKNNLKSALDEKLAEVEGVDVDALVDHLVSKLSLDTSASTKVTKTTKAKTTTSTASPAAIVAAASSSQSSQATESQSGDDSNKCKYKIRKGARNGEMCGKPAKYPDSTGVPNMCCANHSGKELSGGATGSSTPKTGSATKPIPTSTPKKPVITPDQKQAVNAINDILAEVLQE